MAERAPELAVLAVQVEQAVQVLDGLRVLFAVAVQQGQLRQGLDQVRVDRQGLLVARDGLVKIPHLFLQVGCARMGGNAGRRCGNSSGVRFGKKSAVRQGTWNIGARLSASRALGAAVRHVCRCTHGHAKKRSVFAGLRRGTGDARLAPIAAAVCGGCECAPTAECALVKAETLTHAQPNVGLLLVDHRFHGKLLSVGVARGRQIARRRPTVLRGSPGSMH